MPHWKIWIDTGGTFTDCIAIDPLGKFKRLKVLSSSVLRGQIVKQLTPNSFQVQIHWPIAKDIFNGFELRMIGKEKIKRKINSIDLVNSIVFVDKPIREKINGHTIEITSHEEVPVLAARLLTETPLNRDFPQLEMRLGSTRGTNALLERKGAKTAFITTKGFKDLLLIGTQQRNDLFALNVQKEKPFYDVAIEVDERIESDGSILQPLSEKEFSKIIDKLKREKIDSVAIAFLNSYKNPSHELLLEAALLKSGFNFVSVSHRLSNQIKIVPRAETTVVNAYLSPIIKSYLSNIQQELLKGNLKIMTSAGGLSEAENFYPKDSLLSGPAGGVVGAATVAQLSGVDKLITFDMGGTSTDVSLYDQRYDYRYESKVGQAKILSPSLAIETIAAGGGSICDYDGYKLTVGPHSAGASPGPACYGADGPLTITDVNLLLGRLDPAFFALPLHPAKAEEALQILLTKILKSTRKKHKAELVLESLAQIANEKMAEAIKKVSVQNGNNPADYTLLSFGGAGGQHACTLAEMLRMKKILIPYDAGLLSAYGIGHAKIERFEEKLILKPLKEIETSLSRITRQLFDEGSKKLLNNGYSISEIKKEKQLLFLRFKGQESTIELEYNPKIKIHDSFRKKYESIFGHWIDNRQIEVESVKVMLSISQQSQIKPTSYKNSYKPKSVKEVYYNSQGARRKIEVFLWEELCSGAMISGPSMIVSHNSTTVIDRGWKFLLDEHNNAIITTNKEIKKRNTYSDEALLELFSNRFTSVAQEMGAMLQRTSFSVNVKERLDFSCAVLDAKGYLVVNAPHIPVHLGSVGVCVREVKKVIEMNEGDVIITNHPAFGGSHLPDVTLIKPVFYKRKLIGYVANRAHHAEIGGKKPGSMPADATRLEEEGVIIAPTYLVKRNKPQWKEISTIFTSAKYPTRLLEENLADLNGALASVTIGEKGLQELCEKYGAHEVAEYMKRLKKYASGLLAEKLKTSSKKSFSAEEYLDDGSRLKVKFNLPACPPHGYGRRAGKAGIQNPKLIIDFSGSSKIHLGNLNATKAIVQSVVLYVLRLWVNKPIAMNEGLIERVKLILPNGLLDPFSDLPLKSPTSKLPAVVGGNTEVSQRLTDTLLKALQLVAGSQGTMNNFLFGNERFGYYETIGGGTGAGNGFHGADAVHSHMTNTRITDPEILELRYPVRLEKFEIRKNSGGKGKWRGGDGIVREVTFKEAMEVNILSQHRKERPYGLKGGGAGKTGEQILVNTSGGKTKLKGMDSASVKRGDKVIIKTPGGGGWGKQVDKKQMGN
jgi:5-oxoprolinase (ATP-hydrolysing)